MSGLVAQLYEKVDDKIIGSPDAQGAVYERRRRATVDERT
jgi:hypothetical protein